MIPYDYEDVQRLIRRFNNRDDLPAYYMLDEHTQIINDEIVRLFQQQITLLEEVADDLYPQTVDPDYQTIIPRYIEEEYAKNHILIQEKMEQLYAQIDCICPNMNF